MDSISPLPFLVQPTTEQATHEIILVHGFQNPLEKRTQAAKCRQVLESCVLDAARPIRDRVNIRIFVFDGAHILHHGNVALSEAVTDLTTRLEATSKEPSSPLFHRTEEGSLETSSPSSPSRAAVFVAHGIGAWIVKDLLHLLNKGQTQIDPTGLIFLDVPNTLLQQTPLDLLADYFLLEYLHLLSTIFKLDGEEARIRDLRDKLLEVDHAFRKMTDARYGECESIDERDVDNCTFSMKMWCEDVWMSPQPISEPKKPRLEKLQLEEKLREAISMDGFNDPISTPISSPRSSYVTCIDDAPIHPAGESELGHSSPKEGERAAPTGEFSQNNPVCADNDEELEDYRMISRYLSRSSRTESMASGESNQTKRNEDSRDTSESSDWPLKNDKGKGKATAPERLSRIPEEEKSSHADSDYPSSRQRIDEDGAEDEFYSFGKAIRERDAAVRLEDEDAMQLAHHHLELVLWYQQEHFGKQHPKALITKRECINTSMVRGIWFVKPIVRWEKKDLLDVESEMRRVYEGLEEALGPLHRETMVTLAALLSIRVSLVQQKATSWEAMEVILDTLRERLDEPEARTPERLLNTLRIKFKVGISLARIWRHGEAMLEELLEEVDNLGHAVDRKDVEGLSKLRREVTEKVEKLRKQWEEKSSGQKKGGKRS
ncbi:hypothetical protein F4818DRAFT_452084 [Hypoxylon cercidicola]|nr:hypothetical protein F4818DRAFT_452084 [Hypoxylon cercidicola]